MNAASKSIELYADFMKRTFQPAFGDEKRPFQVLDQFPFAIEIFGPDGTAVFVNRTACELWNVSGPEQIIGNYNIIIDPIVNDLWGMRDDIARAFAGETVALSDRIVPCGDLSRRYTHDRHRETSTLYNDIFCFPLLDSEQRIAYVAMVFIIKRLYKGQSDIAKAKNYIEDHWLAAFDLEAIATHVNFSTYHFARLFKKHAGETPYNYYKDVKIKKLKEKLLDRNLSISQVFDECGASYKGSFAKVFKEKTGFTPSQFRKLHFELLLQK